MATPVTQVTPVDPSLAAQANYASFTEYIISGTTYVIDSVAQAVYEFTAGSGILQPTGGSYSAFTAFIASNPVTATAAPPVAAATGALTGVAGMFVPALAYAQQPLQDPADTAIIARLDQLITLSRGMWLAVVALATDGNKFAQEDFAPNTITNTFQ